jgi:hypothetical protein
VLHERLDAGINYFRDHSLHTLWGGVLASHYFWNFLRRKKMEKDVKIGNNGDVDFALVNGKLSITATVSWAPANSGLIVKNSTVVQDDPKVILDKLVASLPAGLLQDLAKAVEAGIIAAAGTATPAAAPSA